LAGRAVPQFPRSERSPENCIASLTKKLEHEPFLRYLVLNNPDGTFFGIADARQIEDISRAAAHRTRPRTRADDKRKALEMMNIADAQVLPVLDEAGRFDGIVDRSKLTASIFAEIAQRVEK
jgi:CBS domain-containing protein